MPLKTSDGIGSWIKDFEKSKAPQFKGKSKEKRRQQAIAAYLSAKDGGRNEEKMKTFKSMREGLDSTLYEMEMLTHKKKIAAAQKEFDAACAAHHKARDAHNDLSKKHGQAYIKAMKAKGHPRDGLFRDPPSDAHKNADYVKHRAHSTYFSLHHDASQGSLKASHTLADGANGHFQHIPKKLDDHGIKLHNKMVDAHHKLQAAKKASPLHKAKSAIHKFAKKVGRSVGVTEATLNENVKPNDVLVKKMKDRMDGQVYATIMFEPKSVLTALKKMVSPEAKKALAGAYMDGTAVVHNKTDATMARMGLNMKLSGLAKEVEQWTKQNVKSKGKKKIREGYESSEAKKKAMHSLSYGGSRDEHSGHEGMANYHASMADEHKGTEAAKHHKRAADHHSRALAAVKKGNIKGGLTHSQNAADAAHAANIAQGNRSTSTRAGKEDSMAVHRDHKAAVNSLGRAQERDAEYSKRNKPARRDRPVARAIGKAKSAVKKAFRTEGYSSAAQRKAVWAARNDEKEKNENSTDDAVKAFLAKGGKIKKLKPAKAQGYHGKDDPGDQVHGILGKDDSKDIGTRKKVKSMEAVKQTKAMHVFDNEKDARAKAKEIGGKYVKGTGKSDGKHAAVKEDDDTARMYKDNPSMMKKGGPAGFKGLNKKGKKSVLATLKDLKKK